MSLRIAETTSTPSNTRKRNESFPCKILLSSFICVRCPDLQVEIHISFPTLLRSFTGPLTGAFEAGQASEVSPRIMR
jgi:hypothetical protein